VLDKLLQFLESLVEKAITLYASYKYGQLSKEQEQLKTELENKKEIELLTNKVKKMPDEELTSLLTTGHTSSRKQ
jgi:hypothetical protein